MAIAYFHSERHQFQLRATGAAASEILSRVIGGLDEAEFDIPGHLVADIAVASEPHQQADGSITVGIEALTVGAD